MCSFLVSGLVSALQSASELQSAMGATIAAVRANPNVDGQSSDGLITSNDITGSNSAGQSEEVPQVVNAFYLLIGCD